MNITSKIGLSINSLRLSLTIQSQLLYQMNLQQYTQEEKDRSKIVGLPVTDKTSTMVGTVKSITGTVAERRDELIRINPS